MPDVHPEVDRRQWVETVCEPSAAVQSSALMIYVYVMNVFLGPVAWE